MATFKLFLTQGKYGLGNRAAARDVILVSEGREVIKTWEVVRLLWDEEVCWREVAEISSGKKRVNSGQSFSLFSWIKERKRARKNYSLIETCVNYKEKQRRRKIIYSEDSITVFLPTLSQIFIGLARKSSIAVLPTNGWSDTAESLIIENAMLLLPTMLYLKLAIRWENVTNSVNRKLNVSSKINVSVFMACKNSQSRYFPKEQIKLKMLCLA